MKKYLNRGFTLIELLVVIAIIGILSSVVLASLNTARGKGANTAIKANLANVRAQAEILYDGIGNYTGLCTNATVAGQMTSAANALGGSVVSVLATAGTATTVVCHLANDNLTWAISSGLKSGDTFAFWCVDSTGASKGHSAALGASATVCP